MSGSGFGIGGQPGSDDILWDDSYTAENVRAMKNAQPREEKQDKRKLLRCPSCGTTGYEGDYPFSTCPPNCDDCT